MSFDGNSTWGINSQMYAKGGLNDSMITSGLSNISTSGSFGFQFGGGFQLHPNMAVGLSYTSGNQSWKTSLSFNGFAGSTSGTFNESGFEIVLSGVLPYKF